MCGGVPTWRCGLQHGGWISRDFECGVYGGLLSLTICEYLGFRKDGPRFWLFDTFHGLPLAQLPADEIKGATKANRLYKTDAYEVAKQNFAPYPNVKLIKGSLPGSLSKRRELKKISYLSMDLNSASAEQETRNALWDLSCPGSNYSPR